MEKCAQLMLRVAVSLRAVRPRVGCDEGPFFGAFCAIFRTLPRGVESRGARIFRALDDEVFFVVEGGVARSLTPR